MTVTLSQLKPGRTARVVAVRSADPARLDRLGAFGLVPGSLVQMAQARPAFVVRIGETEIAVDDEVAAEVVVEE
jgi:Fe2+ transport system protein FeoA